MTNLVAYSVYGDRVEIDPANGLCEDARFIFTNGQCHALAFALFEILTQMGKTCSLIATTGSHTHFAVYIASMDDAVIDVDGIHTMSDFLEECGSHADEQAWENGAPASALPNCYAFASIEQAEEYCDDRGYDAAHMRTARLYAPLVLSQYGL